MLFTFSLEPELLSGSLVKLGSRNLSFDLGDSFDTRLPLLEVALVELVPELPDDLFVELSRTRRVTREMLRFVFELLPDSIFPLFLLTFRAVLNAPYLLSPVDLPKRESPEFEPTAT